MPAPRRYLDTFSVGAGFDIGGWTSFGAGGGGSQNPDFASPAWLQSPYASCLQVVNIAGNGGSNGPSYVYNTLPATVDHDTVLVKLGYDSEGLADANFGGSIILIDPTLAIPLMQCQWVQQSGTVRFEVFGYGNGSAIQIGSDFTLAAQTPIRVFLRVNITGDVYGARINDDAEVTQPITNGTRQITQLGAVVLGNTSTSVNLGAMTQLFAYMQIGDIGPVIARRRAGGGIFPALAPIIGMFGTLWARTASGLYVHKQLPHFPLPQAA